jgi:PPOX class probable F420-dependent enzyme
MSAIPEQYIDLLGSEALAHVATIGPKGEPQSNPVWFGWDGTSILFSQTKDRQKYHNVQHNPQVALSIVDPTNPYRYLEVRGKVIRIDEDKDRAFINAMAKKYLGQDVFPWHRPEDERVIIVIQPQHTTHQNKEKVSHLSKKGYVADAKKVSDRPE